MTTINPTGKMMFKLAIQILDQILHQFTRFYLRSEIYLEPSQTSMIELLSKIINIFQPLTIFLKAPSQMFDWVLNAQLNDLLKYVNQKNIWVFFFHFSFNASRKKKNSRHLLVQSQQRKHQNNVKNLLKVNNKDINGQLLCKSTDWFPYDRDLRHVRIKSY